MKRGEKTPEAEKRRRQRQRKYKRYMELRDELQTLGVIPVEPSGARKSEAVDPATQGEQAMPNLVAQAVRNGWAVPEHKKPDIVDEMLAVIDNPQETNKVKVAAFNALRMADKDQYERDHPEEAAKGKVGVKVAVVNNVQVSDVFGDIEHIKRQLAIEQGSGLPADGDGQSVDEAQSRAPAPQPATDRLPEAR